MAWDQDGPLARYGDASKLPQLLADMLRVRQRERSLWKVARSFGPEERGECSSDDRTCGCANEERE
jgi:hypothetical protein